MKEAKLAKKQYRKVLSFGLFLVMVIGLAFLLTGCQVVNQDPDAAISTTPSAPDGTVYVEVGDPITFDGSASEDPDEGSSISSWEWEFGDGYTATGETVDHSYESRDTYTVTLTVTDENGGTDSTTVEVEVSEESELSASFTMSPNPAQVGEEVQFDASGSTGNIASYDWYFDSPDATPSEIDGGQEVTHSYTQTGSYLVSLRVTAENGDVAGVADTIVVEES